MQLKTIFREMRLFAATCVLISLLLPNAALAFPQSSASGDTTLTEDEKIIHVLNRLGYGPRPGDLEKVRKIGLRKYIEQQISGTAPNGAIANRLAGYEILKLDTPEIFARYPNPGALLEIVSRGERVQAAENDDERRARREKLAEIYRKYDLRPANQIMMQVQSSRIVSAVYSENQLEEVMVDFWANHFNVFSGKAATRWYIPSYERDVLRKHALGNFRDLVAETAKHPAMLFYLDNFQSVAPNAGPGNERNRRRLQNAIRNGQLDPRVRRQLRSRGLSEEEIDRRVEQLKQAGNRNERGINENYARELMELHTLGVDGGYTQEDIREVARAFTGWTIFDARGYRKAAARMGADARDTQIERQARQLGVSPDTESGTFIFVDRLHDKDPKTVLGRKVDEGGIKDGLKVIDILVSHPSTAKFIARKLAVKFVNDEPDEALVSRVAEAFTRSKGDIRTTLSALFSDEEFFARRNYRAKIKTPFELLVSSLRALDSETDGGRPLIALLAQMGEPLYGYQAPTGYPDTAADWVNTGALLERMNFAVALASNRIPRTRVNLSKYTGGTRSEILGRVAGDILGSGIPDETLALLERQMEQPVPDVKISSRPDEPDDLDDIDADGDRRMRRNMLGALLQPLGDPEVFKAVGLILGSPDFQRQ